MSTELYIDQPLPQDLTRILYMIKDENLDTKSQLEQSLSEMSDDALLAIDEEAEFRRHMELYNIGTISAGAKNEDGTRIKNLTLHVPLWFLQELEPHVQVKAVGSSKCKNIGYLLEHLSDYELLE